MKKTIPILILAGLTALLATATAQPAAESDSTNTATADQAPPSDAGNPPPPDAGNPPLAGEVAPAADDASAAANQGPAGSTLITPSRNSPNGLEAPSAYMPPMQAGTNLNDLNLNFNHAPLDMVLNYLSDAAGFIIVQQTRINPNVSVTVNGKHLSRDEAVDLLNSVLNESGYAAIRDGRTLTILDKTEAKTSRIPVKSGNIPDQIPNNAEIVTQIIPIRFVEAQQLVSDLSSFVSPQATVVANEAGNSIVITDTQANIRHLMQIIKAIDDSAEAETEIRVFRLKYASPTDVAAELSSVFPSSTSGNNSQSPIRFGGAAGGRFAGLFGGGAFGGGGGFPGGGGGGGGRGGGASSAANDRIRKATQVSAVADSRIQAVIVTAPKDLMEEIAGMMKELDVASDRDQDVYVFKMNNGDPQQAVQVLQNMFQGSNARTQTGQSQNSPLQQRSLNSTTQMGSQSSGSGFGSGGVGGGGGGGGGRTY